MKLFCCQFDIAWEKKPENYARVRALLGTVHIPPGSLVLLPEMFSTGFSMNVPAIREGTSSETEAFLAGLARELNVFVLAGLVSAAPDGKGRNEAVIFSPDGKEVARYAKLQPFTYGGEMNNYHPGNEVVTWTWNNCLASPFICYDLRFPEIFRAAVRRGAQLLTVIANWPSTRIAHWVALLQARAIENQAYVAGVNRCGTDPKLVYTGRSLIVSPRGEILADAGEKETVISADIDVDALTAYRTELPFLRDMRADF